MRTHDSDNEEDYVKVLYHTNVKMSTLLMLDVKFPQCHRIILPRHVMLL